jgi:hypothetical protein
MDEAVFRLSAEFDGGNGGELTESFATDVFRESHEKGLVSFLLGGAELGSFEVDGADGGGDHGTEGSEPDKPMSEDVIEDVLDGCGGFFSGSILDTLSQRLNHKCFIARILFKILTCRDCDGVGIDIFF